MDYRQLGRSNLNVSAIALGTMTWGEQNTQDEAFEQIEYAKNAGINFLDTAEMYPVPPKAETYATTERYIGNWFKARGDRADWVLASKIAGPGNTIDYIRDGNLKHNRTHIVQALDASLKRLQTDWIDLYQLHWPERSTNFFGQLGYTHKADEDFTPLEDTLEALDEQVKNTCTAIASTTQTKIAKGSNGVLIRTRLCSHSGALPPGAGNNSTAAPRLCAPSRNSNSSQPPSPSCKPSASSCGVVRPCSASRRTPVNSR